MRASTYQFGGHNSTKHYLTQKTGEVTLEEWRRLGENWRSKAGWWEKNFREKEDYTQRLDMGRSRTSLSTIHQEEFQAIRLGLECTSHSQTRLAGADCQGNTQQRVQSLAKQWCRSLQKVDFFLSLAEPEEVSLGLKPKYSKVSF